MTLPVLDKTWNTEANVEFRNTGVPFDDWREMLFQIKNRMVNMPVPWTVSGSSNGIVSGMDGVDRWLTATDLNFGTSTRAWIVLRQAAISPQFEVLIYCTNTNAPTKANIKVSPVNGFGVANGGLDGGTNSNNRPTATDEIEIIGTNSTWLNGDASADNSDHIFHYWQSTDGECTRIKAFRVNTNENCLDIAFEKPKNPALGWANPSIFFWRNASSEISTMARLNDLAAVFTSLDIAAKCYLTLEGATSQMSNQHYTGANEITGEWDIYPMGVFCNIAPYRGRLGERFDIWYVPTALPNGATMPLTPAPTREFACFGDTLCVWDGTLPVLL